MSELILQPAHHAAGPGDDNSGIKPAVSTTPGAAPSSAAPVNSGTVLRRELAAMIEANASTHVLTLDTLVELGRRHGAQGMAAQIDELNALANDAMNFAQKMQEMVIAVQIARMRG